MVTWKGTEKKLSAFMNESKSSLVWILYNELLRTGESKVNKLSLGN